MGKNSQRNPFEFTLMCMQVIWKIKHQKSKFSRQENLCTQILLPANGICAEPQ